MRSTIVRCTLSFVIPSSLCFLAAGAIGGLTHGQEVKQGNKSKEENGTGVVVALVATSTPIQPVQIQPVQSQPPAGQVQWGELDLDSILNRPLDANRSMSRLKTDRRFLDESSIPDTTRLQIGDGSPYLWEGTGYTWHSAAFCHSPLYFEQPNLERYGQGPCHPWATPVSAGRFLGQVTTLPLAVIWSPPWSRSCTLGHHRPGDLAPWQRKGGSH